MIFLDKIDGVHKLFAVLPEKTDCKQQFLNLRRQLLSWVESVEEAWCEETLQLLRGVKYVSNRFPENGETIIRRVRSFGFARIPENFHDAIMQLYTPLSHAYDILNLIEGLESEIMGCFVKGETFGGNLDVTISNQLDEKMRALILDKLNNLKRKIDILAQGLHLQIVVPNKKLGWRTLIFFLQKLQLSRELLTKTLVIWEGENPPENREEMGHLKNLATDYCCPQTLQSEIFLLEKMCILGLHPLQDCPVFRVYLTNPIKVKKWGSYLLL